MDRVKNKSWKNYPYVSRYTKFPYYYQELDEKYFYGLTDNINKNVTYLIHKVLDYDTLDLLSFNYYGRPDYYWIIADFNNIKDPFIKLSDKYKKLKIPTLTKIYFGDN
jgi:hypothetical protein